MSTDSDGDGTRGIDGNREDSSDGVPLGRPSIEDASGIGLSMMLATGVLLAFGYYGVRSVAESGLGQVIPAPFYLLALAVVFLVELSRNPSLGARALARTAGITAVYGTLVVLAIEGAGYLWEQPGAALDGFVGVTVLAVALVVSALAYVAYLSTVEAADRPRGDAI